MRFKDWLTAFNQPQATPLQWEGLAGFSRGFELLIRINDLDIA
jgi:hypothetical protein